MSHRSSGMELLAELPLVSKPSWRALCTYTRLKRTLPGDEPLLVCVILLTSIIVLYFGKLLFTVFAWSYSITLVSLRQHIHHVPTRIDLKSRWCPVCWLWIYAVKGLAADTRRVGEPYSAHAMHIANSIDKTIYWTPSVRRKCSHFEWGNRGKHYRHVQTFILWRLLNWIICQTIGGNCELNNIVTELLIRLGSNIAFLW